MSNNSLLSYPQPTRTPFDEQALADKRRYEQEMGVFKPARDPNKPKRPSTAYFHFLADFRQKMKGSDIGHKDVIRWVSKANDLSFMRFCLLNLHNLIYNIYLSFTLSQASGSSMATSF